VEQATQPPPPIVPPTAGLIDDFESRAELWETSTDGMGSTVECGPDTGMAHGGAASLRIQYSLVPDGWGDCGRSFESPQDWSGGEGLSLWIHSDGAGQWVTLMLFSGDPAGPTPFEVYFETTAESAEAWAQVVFSWTDFVRAEWAEEGGLSELDPAQVVGIGFSFGADDTRSEGILWVDDVGLVTGMEPPPALVTPGEEPPPGTVTPPATTPLASGEQAGSEGGICPGAAVALPLGVLGVLLVGRRRRDKEQHRWR